MLSEHLNYYQVKNENSLSGSEKRKDPRRTVRWLLDGFNKDKIEFKGKTENISRSGLLLLVESTYHDKFEIGGRLVLNIKTYYKSENRVINCVVTIKHISYGTEGRKLGVEFIYISRENKEWLSKFSYKKI